MTFGQNNPPYNQQYGYTQPQQPRQVPPQANHNYNQQQQSPPQPKRQAQQNMIPVQTAVLEKYNALKSTLIYLLVGIALTFVLYAFNHLYVAGAGLIFYFIVIFLTKREMDRLQRTYLR